MAKIGYQRTNNRHLVWNLLSDADKKKMSELLPKRWRVPDGFRPVDAFAGVEPLPEIAEIMSEQPRYTKPAS